MEARRKCPRFENREPGSHALCSGLPVETTAHGNGKNGKIKPEGIDNILCKEELFRKEVSNRVRMLASFWITNCLNQFILYQLIPSIENVGYASIFIRSPISSEKFDPWTDGSGGVALPPLSAWSLSC